jgi:hypothetical protein
MQNFFHAVLSDFVAGTMHPALGSQNLTPYPAPVSD